MAHTPKLLILGLLACTAGHAGATGPLDWLGGFKLASEIVVTPWGGNTKGSSTGASTSRQKAQAAANPGAAPPSTQIVIETDDEDGVLSRPRTGAPTDNRDKARNYSRGSDAGSPATIRILTDNTAEGTDTNRDSLEKNRSKARRYAEGASDNSGKAGTFIKIGPATGVMGVDGVVMFSCDDTNNIAGRIGDDSQPGNVFAIVVNGKMIKARCK